MSVSTVRIALIVVAAALPAACAAQADETAQSTPPPGVACEEVVDQFLAGLPATAPDPDQLLVEQPTTTGPSIDAVIIVDASPSVLRVDPDAPAAVLSSAAAAFVDPRLDGRLRMRLGELSAAGALTSSAILADVTVTPVETAPALMVADLSPLPPPDLGCADPETLPADQALDVEAQLALAAAGHARQVAANATAVEQAGQLVADRAAERDRYRETAVQAREDAAAMISALPAPAAAPHSRMLETAAAVVASGDPPTHVLLVTDLLSEVPADTLPAGAFDDVTLVIAQIAEDFIAGAALREQTTQTLLDLGAGDVRWCGPAPDVADILTGEGC